MNGEPHWNPVLFWFPEPSEEDPNGKLWIHFKVPAPHTILMKCLPLHTSPHYIPDPQCTLLFPGRLGPIPATGGPL